MNKTKEGIFARKNDNGNYDILHVEDGYPVTRIDSDEFPIGSEFGTRYEHPEGIELTEEQVKSLGIQFE